MRILITGNYGDFTSTEPFVVPADGQWHHGIFGLTEANMTWGGTQGGASHSLTNALRVMGGFFIRHQTGPPLGFLGSTRITSSVGIDNIQALPEPGMLTMAIMLGGCLGTLRRCRS